MTAGLNRLTQRVTNGSPRRQGLMTVAGMIQRSQRDTPEMAALEQELEKA